MPKFTRPSRPAVSNPEPRTVGVVSHPSTGRRYRVKLALEGYVRNGLPLYYAVVCPMEDDGTLIPDRVRMTFAVDGRRAAFDAAMALVDADARRELI